MELRLSVLYIVGVMWTLTAARRPNIPGLYISNSTAILFTSNPDGGETDHVWVVFSQPHGRIVGLAVDSLTGRLFWSDIGYQTKGIYTATISEGPTLQQVTRIISTDIYEVNGLAVDWVSWHIYWTDARKRMIEMAEFDGSNRRTLSISGLVCPRGIAVDPHNGYLFWNDQCSHKIGRSHLDGSEHQTFINSSIYWPNQMALSDSTLYWVDAWNKTLMSAPVTDASRVRRRAVLVSTIGDNPVFGLAIHGDWAYVSAWHKGLVVSVHLTTGMTTEVKDHLGSDAMFSLVYSNLASQKPGTNECSRSGKGGCSHLCLPIDNTRYRCSCPSYGGLALDMDKKHCRTPVNILLYTLADSGEVGFVDLDGATTIDKYLVGRSLRPVAVTYDPVMQEVYWSDVHEKSIHRAKLNGTAHGVFMGFNQSIGVVDGLALDYIHRRLYFSNMGVMVLQGAGFSWHKIEMIDLDGTDRRVVVNSAEKPRGLWLDLDKKYLYYTDWGSNAMAVRCDLDGSNPLILRAGLDNPNAVVVQAGDIYVVDSHAKSRDPNRVDKSVSPEYGSVHITDDTGSQWDDITDIDLKMPFGMASYGNLLYISDWNLEAVVSVTVHNKALGRRLSSPPEVSTVLSGVKTPMGLHQSRISLTPEPDSACTTSQCEEICVVDPIGGDTCTCPSYNSQTLAEDLQSCTQPENFMLVADMNSVQMRSLDTGDHSLYTVVQGTSYLSNFAGLVYDENTTDLYFSDVNRRVIYQTKLNGSESRVFYRGNLVVDGIALDPGSALYWTDFLSGTISSVDLSGDHATYRTLVKGLSLPRAIRLDHKNSFIYWTEWGTLPRVARANMADGSHVRTVMTTGLKKPNGLFLDIDKGHMYIGDGEDRKVLKCNLDGSQCLTLAYVTGVPQHIFDLQKFGDFLYLTDWTTRSLTVVSIQTGVSKTIMDNLMRPTALHIKFSGIPECPQDHGCSDECLAYLGGYFCTCSPGHQLKADGKTCMNVNNPYLEADPSHCDERCLPNRVCSQEIGTPVYKCHCKPGYELQGNICSACAQNYFKAWIGPGSCRPCPTSSTSDAEGSTECHCDLDLAWNWKEFFCDGEKPGSCPSNPVLFGDQCDSVCNSENECQGAKKCCQYSGCPQNQCVDPSGLPECVFNGVPYWIGQTFKPTACLFCQCNYDKTSGNPKYGFAQCSAKPCPPPPCSQSAQILKDGECCPVCRDTEEPPLEFTGCPSDTVEVFLAPDKGYVNYDPNLRVRDNTRLNRDVKVTRIPDSSIFWWKGVGSDSEQTVTATASAQSPLGASQVVTCTYQVLVVDDTPPQVLCPGDVNVYTANGTAHVIWPYPVIQENVGLMAPPVSQPETGKRLNIGTHPVSYTVTDKAGHASSCTFKVHILKEKFECSSINMYPIRGQLNCDVETCSVKCQHGYNIDRWYNVRDVYTCLKNEWTPKFISHFDIFACVRIEQPRWHTSGKFVVPSTFFNQNHDVGTLFKELLTHQTGWRDAFSVRTDVENQGSITEIHFVLMASEGEKNETSSEVGDELLDVLDSLKVALAARNAEGSLSHNVIEVGCVEGQQAVDVGCLVCPAGSFHQSSPSVCLPCPVNTYQDKEGQTSCIPCPDKGISPAGSYTLLQCVMAQTHRSTSTQSQVIHPTIIIGIACGAVLFIIIIILIIIVLVVRTRRNRKRPKPLPDEGPMQFDNDAYMEATGFPSADLPGSLNPPVAPPVPEKVAFADDNSNMVRTSAHPQEYEYLEDPDMNTASSRNPATPDKGFDNTDSD